MPYFTLIIMFYHVKIACYQGLTPHSVFASDVAEHGALDKTVQIETRRSRRLRSI